MHCCLKVYINNVDIFYCYLQCQLVINVTAAVQQQQQQQAHLLLRSTFIASMYEGLARCTLNIFHFLTTSLIRLLSPLNSNVI